MSRATRNERTSRPPTDGYLTLRGAAIQLGTTNYSVAVKIAELGLRLERMGGFLMVKKSDLFAIEAASTRVYRSDRKVNA